MCGTNSHFSVLFFFLLCISLFMAMPGLCFCFPSVDKELDKLSGKETLDRILANMDREYKKIKSLHITFEQTKNLMLMAQPLNSKGELIYKRPGSLYWKFNNPDPSVMVVKGNQLIIHYPDLKQADVMDIAKYKERVAKYLGFADSMTKLKRYYHIRIVEQGATTYWLELLPKKRRIKQKIKQLWIWLSKTTWLPVKVQYKEPNDDLTIIKISKCEVNGDIDSSVFNYTLPSDTKITHLLGKKETAIP